MTRHSLRRGLLWLWALFAVVWGLVFLGLAAPTWYGMATGWYRARGFEVERASCSDVEANRPPEYVPSTDELRARMLGRDCFYVTLPSSAKFLLELRGRFWTTAEIKFLAMNNPKLFSRSSQDIFGDLKPPPIPVLDLTSSYDSARLALLPDDADLVPAKTLTVLAFAVPAGVLILGCGLWWAAMRFRAGSRP